MKPVYLELELPLPLPPAKDDKKEEEKDRGIAVLDLGQNDDGIWVKY